MIQTTTSKLAERRHVIRFTEQPSGGGACTNRSYSMYYYNDFEGFTDSCSHNNIIVPPIYIINRFQYLTIYFRSLISYNNIIRYTLLY